jgi:tetratricopeptide (TPR) repeat protein
VTYISARAGLLSALFSLVVLTLFFARPFKGWLALAVVSFLLALFSKEDAVSLPLLLFFISYIRKESSIKSKNEILYLASFFVIALIYGALRVTSHKVVLGETGGATFYQTLLLSPYVLGKSFAMILLPIGMTADHYVAPITTFGDVRLWGALLFCLSVLIGALYGIKKNSLIAFPLLWFLIALLPSVLTPLADPFAENRLYFATAGIALGMGMFIERVMLDVASSPTRRIVLISAVLLMIMSMLSYNLHRQSIWNSKVRLWGEAVRMAPDKTRPLDNLALTFFDLRDLKKAQFLTEKSLKVDPKDAVAWNTLGLVLKEEKRYNEALSAYEKALSLAPSLPKIRTNIANVLATLGKYDEAIRMYEEALLVDSDADAHFGLGIVYFKMKRYDLAKAHILQTLKLNPKDVEAQMLLWEIEKIEKR